MVSIPAFASSGSVRNLARKIIILLNEGQFNEAESNFDSTMKKAAPEDNLRLMWSFLIEQTGPLKEELGDTILTYKGYTVVTVTCSFTKSDQDIRIVFDNENKVAGLFIDPRSESEKLLAEVLDFINSLNVVSTQRTRSH